MSKESEREAIIDETHQVQHQEQEELDEIQEEEVEREKIHLATMIEARKSSDRRRDEEELQSFC